MSRSVLRTAVSGLGRIAWQFHLPALWKESAFALVAVSDPVEARRHEAESTYSGVKAYADFEEMVEREHPDLVVLASPTLFHYSQALFAMMHGAHVFCEKPLSSSYAEAMELMGCAKATGRKIMAFQPHRIHPEFVVLKDILASGKLGRVFQSRRVSHTYNRRNDWQSRLDCGGGMLFNSGAHFVDQFLGMFGGGPLEIDGVCLQRAVSVGDAEDVVSLQLHNGSGVSGQIDINLAAAYGESSWTVFGTCGTARYSSSSQAWELKFVDPQSLPDMCLQPDLAASGRKYNVESGFAWQEERIELPAWDLADYYEYVRDYFLGGKEPFVPLEETVEVMRILTQCRKAPIHSLQTLGGMR